MQLTLGDLRDAQEPWRAILGRVPALMPGSCPFWLADTAGWKNSAGICSRGLEASGEKGLGGAAGEEEEVLGTAQEVGTEQQPSLGLLNTGCETLGRSPTRSFGVFAVRARNAAGAIPGKTSSEQKAALRAQQTRLQA